MQQASREVLPASVLTIFHNHLISIDSRPRSQHLEGRRVPKLAHRLGPMMAILLANDLNQRTLLIEADRRSGALSILLNVEDRGGLAEVLTHAGSLTRLEWRRHLVSIGKLDLLLANPSLV